jgi:hypothetical protein
VDYFDTRPLVFPDHTTVQPYRILSTAGWFSF